MYDDVRILAFFRDLGIYRDHLCRSRPEIDRNILSFEQHTVVYAFDGAFGQHIVVYAFMPAESSSFAYLVSIQRKGHCFSHAVLPKFARNSSGKNMLHLAPFCQDAPFNRSLLAALFCGEGTLPRSLPSHFHREALAVADIPFVLNTP